VQTAVEQQLANCTRNTSCK